MSASAPHYQLRRRGVWTDKRTDGIAISISSVAFMTDAESCFKNIMHLRDRGCVLTLRPLFVYATGLDLRILNLAYTVLSGHSRLFLLLYIFFWLRVLN